MLRLEVFPYEVGETRGFFPTADRQDLQRLHAWVVWVAGLWHHDADAQSGNFAPGNSLALIPDTDNEWDEHAVGVWDSDEIRQAGWLPSAYVQQLEPVRRDGLALLEHINEEGHRDGLLIVASRSPLRFEIAGEALSERDLSYANRWLRNRPVPPPPTPQLDPLEAMRRMLAGES